MASNFFTASNIEMANAALGLAFEKLFEHDKNGRFFVLDPTFSVAFDHSWQGVTGNNIFTFRDLTLNEFMDRVGGIIWDLDNLANPEDPRDYIDDAEIDSMTAEYFDAFVEEFHRKEPIYVFIPSFKDHFKGISDEERKQLPSRVFLSTTSNLESIGEGNFNLNLSFESFAEAGAMLLSRKIHLNLLIVDDDPDFFGIEDLI